jgi:hypothetical protein
LPRALFTDCVGALDGTHINVHLSPADQARYRNRKGHLTQNVLEMAGGCKKNYPERMNMNDLNDFMI